MAIQGLEIQDVNYAYLLELYDKYRQDPSLVDAATRALFLHWTPPETDVDHATAVSSAVPGHLAVRAVNLAQSIRRYGHLAARIDPLGTRETGDPSLQPETHDVTEHDLRALPASLMTGAVAEDATTMWEVVGRLREIYLSTTGYDFAHVFVPEERAWLRGAVEIGRYRAPADPIDPVALLGRLTQVEAFERFLQRAFPGKTRFSIEGLDMLVPILDEIIAEACEAGMHDAFIAMAHRGRLNVIAHVLGKPYAQVLLEFKDAVGYARLVGPQATGDVTYHRGASRAVQGGKTVRLVVSMPPNPSHLEAIDPVLEGMARAAGTDVGRPGAPVFNPDTVLPILIHGDAAFPGQGVVAETLNLHRLAGYSTGGTIHIIANNQIGFTTSTAESYSTLYASGLARGFKIPIVHVNADDPEACVAAARLAFGYRDRFRRDFLIDLVGYRRHGHNEGDEPSFTQPHLYQKIASHPTVRQSWAMTLESSGRIDTGQADAMLAARLDALQQVFESLDPERHAAEAAPVASAPGTAARAETAVPLDRLRALNDALLALPDGFTVHPKLARGRDRRRHLFDDPQAPVTDRAAAEELALATILEDGVAVRLTGQDVERGTFGHRNAVLHDAHSGARHVPLQAIARAYAACEIVNSPLSENAALAFEFGYNVQAPHRLVIWEAQYGDFVNGAQVVLDEFVVSARAKWGQQPSLVLLLPHAYEGQGPDHASARPERFLQLAADVNMRVVNCTTAAQYFHLLRRQAALLERDPLPLVVLTPKSLLRHPRTASAPRELAEGRWRQVIEDQERRSLADGVRRLVFCSGKIAIDLLSSPLRTKAADVAVCRVEQLYPLPVRDMVAAMDPYPRLEEVMWAQEEPENMGAWEFVRPSLASLVGSRRLAVLARPRSSSPAEGSPSAHARNQETLIARALSMSDVAVRP